MCACHFTSSMIVAEGALSAKAEGHRVHGHEEEWLSVILSPPAPTLGTP